MLLEQPGQVVLREEIRQRLWPNDTIVEFDHSINAAIKKLRRALDDEPEEPVYVETVARRGYRLKASVEWIETAPAEAPVTAAPALAPSEPEPSPEGFAGRQVSHYRILEKVGGGGMGVVYRAEDLLLPRLVALKFLPEDLAGAPQALERLKQEARAAASLNHPNICVVYEIGEHEGQPFIAMEYLEGQTLKHRITPGMGLVSAQGHSQGASRRIVELLDLAIQIAGGLDAAHRKGIIHRDIKPANIFVTTRGEAKVLDFGLAKLSGVAGASPTNEDASGGAGPHEAPTLEGEHLTSPGVAMGTAAYMSPEQARGEELDARTDVFSFGAVLYEMATGRQAFSGTTTAIIHDAILNRAPTPAAELNPDMPLDLQRIINNALEKDRDLRCQSAAEIRADLKRLKRDTGSGRTAASSSGAGAALSRVKPAGRRWLASRLAWALAGTVAIAAIVLALSSDLRQPAPEALPMRFPVSPPENAAFNFGGPFGGAPMVSPDGRQVAFLATSTDGKKLLWVRPLNGESSRPLADTEGAFFPFWSPDSRSIGFFTSGKLKKIEIAGGTVETLCDARIGRGGTWNRDGVIVFAPDIAGPLFRVSVSGGAPVRVTRLDESGHEESHRWPYFLPDGRHFLFLKTRWAGSDIGADNIYAGSLDSAETQLVAHATSRMAYADGYLLYLTGTTLLAQRFDPTRRQAFGEAMSLAPSVEWDPVGAGIFSVSEKGILAYKEGALALKLQLAWFDRSGRQISPLGQPQPQIAPQLSPDGRRLAVLVVGPSGTEDLWVYDLSTSSKTRLTFGSSVTPRHPIWSPDGARIAFSSDRSKFDDLYAKRADGSGDEEILQRSDADKSPTDWSRDGRFLAFDSQDPKRNTKTDIWMLPLLGDRKPFAFLETPADERGARFSPDGRWIAYTSDETGRDEVYVVPFARSGGKWLISAGGGSNPVWRRDGKELFYLAEDKTVMSASLKVTNSSPEISAVQPLFSPGPTPHPELVYDVSADGQRFIVDLLRDQDSSPFTVVVNWTAALPKN